MCKLYIVAGPLTPKQVKGALTAANRCFRSEPDGFGFLAAQGVQIARGRYLEPARFIGYMQNMPDWLTGPNVEENRLPAKVDTLICHGRTSTNTKGLDNVHPFHFKGQFLAHNGMVCWNGPTDQKPKPSCDSEQLLHWLVENNCDWDKAFHAWGGWGAVVVYDRKSARLTVARDGATLHIARRVKDKGWVLATCEKHLQAISKAAGITLDTVPLTFPRHIVQFRHGKIVMDRDWVGFGARQWTPLDTVSYGKATWTTKRTSFPDYEPKGK